MQDAFEWVNGWLNGGGPFSAGPPHAAAAAEGDGQAGSPGDSEPAAQALAVEGREAKVLHAAWSKLRSEFEVQERVWADVARLEAGCRGGSAATFVDSRREDCGAVIQRALAASAGDPAGAVKQLRPLSKAETTRTLSRTCVTAVHGVMKAERQVQLLHRLAAHLRGLAEGHTTAKKADDAQMEELESLVAGCHLPALLESSVRKTLGLGPSKAELARQEKAAKDEVRRAEAAEARAAKEREKAVAGAAGVSQEKAHAAVKSAKGDADLALIMLLSEGDARTRRKEREQQKKEHEKQKKEHDMAAAIRMKAAEASEMATAMSNIAEATHRMAWARVRSELQVQVEVWRSQALLAKSAGRKLPLQEAQQGLQAAVDAADADPAGGVLALENALQNTVERGMQLSAGMLAAADGVLDQDRTAESRRALAAALSELAKVLEEGAGAEVSTRSPTAERARRRKEFEALLEACDLGSSDLVYRAKQLFSAKVDMELQEERRVRL